MMHVSTTEWTALTADMYSYLDHTYWLAGDNLQVYTGVYEWRQGRDSDGFVITDGFNEWVSARSITHIMRLIVPKHPLTT